MRSELTSGVTTNASSIVMEICYQKTYIN